MEQGITLSGLSATVLNAERTEPPVYSVATFTHPTLRIHFGGNDRATIQYMSVGYANNQTFTVGEKAEQY